MSPEASLWPSNAGDRGITSGTFYGNLRRYLKAANLPLAGVHIFRHSAAKLRRDAGESIENVSRFLDHSSLQVTVDLPATPGGRGGRVLGKGGGTDWSLTRSLHPLAN
jgi:site-specific recombinase XerD